MGVVFGPDSTQFSKPAVILQKRDLLAAVAAGPAATVADEKSMVEYSSVHSTEAAGSPVEPFRLRLRLIVDPGFAEPEETPSVSPCEKQTEQAIKPTIGRRAVIGARGR